MDHARRGDPGAAFLMTSDYRDIPIFIQSFNQVSHLRKQIDWLLSAGHRRLIVVDNASTYEPLLQYCAREISSSRRSPPDSTRARSFARFLNALHRSSTRSAASRACAGVSSK